LLLIAREPDIPQLVIHEGVGKHGQQRTIFRAPAFSGASFPSWMISLCEKEQSDLRTLRI